MGNQIGLIASEKTLEATFAWLLRNHLAIHRTTAAPDGNAELD
jgi:hypothetical protein